MLTAAIVVIAAVAAWVLIDRWLLRRDETLRRGRAAWSQSGGPDRTFHSTGWEETVPPLEPVDPRLQAVRRRAERRAA
ncbi:MAG: hypothetical protein H7Y61_08725 [Rhizobiales bacterium]|nr:hypothetical protein [Rhizobacter sp.]